MYVCMYVCVCVGKVISIRLREQFNYSLLS